MKRACEQSRAIDDETAREPYQAVRQLGSRLAGLPVDQVWTGRPGTVGSVLPISRAPSRTPTSEVVQVTGMDARPGCNR
jgi:hypothetical protein